MGSEINIKKRIDVKEEGVSITPDVNSINFVGDGVTASASGNDVTVNIPGGQGTTTYYLNETITQAPYKEFSSISSGAVQQSIVTSVAAGATATIQSFQTASGVPGTTNIPGGLWSFYLHFSGTPGDTWSIFAEVYVRDLGGIETLLLTTDATATSTLAVTPAMFLTDGVFPASTVLTTDRIVVKVKVTNTDTTTNSITFYTEGSTNYSVSITTLNQVVPTGAVTNVTGTAPIASSGGTTPAISISQSSAVSDGYLSSTDWTTFNNKLSQAYTTVEDEGTPLTQRSTINFVGAGVTATDSGGKTVVTIPQGGLTYFTEAQSTAAPNATVNVDSLTAVASTTDADFAIIPKGTGAILAAIPDNAVTGGNKRGQYAVDLSINRVGAANVASGANSFNAGTNSRASGPNSVAFNGNATGANSFSINQIVTGGTGGTASGLNSFSMGRAVASGGQSFAFGGYYVQVTASGSDSIAMSEGNTASGNYSCAIGGYQNIASGFASYASGNQANTFSLAGRQSRGYLNTVSGDCQKSEFFLSVRTTGNTATTITVGGGAASATNQVILSNNSAYGFTGTIVGKQSGSTNACMWKVTGLIARGANAASTTLTFSSVDLVSNAPAWGTPTLASDTTNGGLRVQVVGLAATNIQWTAVIETTEVIYA